MIRRRTVILLGGVTLAAVIGAVVATVDRTAETRTEVEAQKLYPELQNQAERVNQVRVARAEGADTGTVTLTRAGDGWMLEERDGYPVRTDLVRKLLFDLAQLELIERKTADPTRFDRLDLADISQKGSKASRLMVTAEGGGTLVDLYVGKQRQSLSGGDPMVYVRRANEDRAYLAEGELDLRGAPVQWLPREVVNIPKDTIVSATLTSAGGEALRLERGDGKDFRIVDMPAGRKIDSQYTVNNAATVIDKLLFDDVRSAEGLNFGEHGGGVFVTRDGLTVTLDVAEAAAKRGDDAGGRASWIRVGIEIGEDATEDARKLGEAMRAQTDGWAYRLSSYDLDRLRATAESLTKPAEGS